MRLLGVWCCIGWCARVCIHVVLLVARCQFGAVFPLDAELSVCINLSEVTIACLPNVLTLPYI